MLLSLQYGIALLLAERENRNSIRLSMGLSGAVGWRHQSLSVSDLKDTKGSMAFFLFS